MKSAHDSSGSLRAPLAGSAAVALLLALAGCGSSGGGSGSGSPAASGPPVSVTARDFHSDRPAPGQTPGADHAASTTTPTGSPGAETSARPKIVEPLTVQSSVAAEGLKDVAVLVGDPKGVVSATAQPAAGAVTIDALVGQINGKPIYADKFFAPLDAAMKSDRAKIANNEVFLRRASEVMYGRLKAILVDELLTAEARAELSPEQRQGLFYFVNQVRESLAAQYGGSREVAEQSLQDKEGRGFEAQVEEEKRKVLQSTVLRKYVTPRVNVSWRDVLRAYERDYLQAADKSFALVRMIWIEPKEATAIQGVTEAIAAGKPFVQIADNPANIFPKGDDGVIRCEYKGEYATATLMDDAALNKLAQTLTRGSVAGPLDYRTASRKDVKVWMTLEDIQRPSPTPLDDVQLKLYRDLSARKGNEEQEKFFLRLIERASFSPLTDMLERLVVIASERYPAPQGTPTLPPPGSQPANSKR